MKRASIISICLLWSLAGFGQESLSVAGVFSSGAVLQCEKPVPVWGTCDPDSRVRIFLDETLVSEGRSDNTGNWMITLPAREASFATREVMIVSEPDTIVLEDILFGEVWLASGQSNMEYPMGKASGGDDFLENENEYIRVLRVPHRRGLLLETGFEKDDLKWERMQPEFSAVALYVAADLQENLDRPVGIIQSAWGGTNCETWTPLPEMKEDPQLAPRVEKLMEAKYEKKAEEFEQEVRNYDAWVYETSRRKSAGEPPSDTPKPALSQYNPQSKNAPSSLYRNMILPFQPFSIRGVLWYQGESNAYMHSEYFPLFQALVNGWRKGFQQDDLPFLFVQLPSYSKDFRDMRLVQARLRDSIDNVEMVCAIDCGEEFNGHPKDKSQIGGRLALLSLKYVYGKNLEARSPLPKQAFLLNKKEIIVQYDYAGEGLRAEGEEIPGFEVAGKNMEFVPARATLFSDNEILLESKIKKPLQIRYAYVNWPDPPLTLYNSAGLPAEPFVIPVVDQ